MNKDKFIYYSSVDKVLKDDNFFGLTAKRNKETNRILYNYRNIKYPNVLISVLTMKLDPTNILSDKIVLGIKFNDVEIEGWKEFRYELCHVYKYNRVKELMKKLKIDKDYGNIKKT